MSDHHPECFLANDCKHDYFDGPPVQCANCGEECICDRLRACEQRSYSLGIEVGKHDGWVAGHAAGVQAASDAVAALPANQRRSNEDGMGGYVQHADGMGTAVSHPETFTEYLTRSAALAVIDALKEKP